MNPRQAALKRIQKYTPSMPSIPPPPRFAEHVFEFESCLARNIVSHLKEVMQGKLKLNPLFAEAIATAMKNWAEERGATHFCHWFQPLTGASAEKHDAFFDGQGAAGVIEKLSGNQLMRGEPDASSFPHGGLRSTSEARGYTTWDPTALPFLKEVGPSKVLCIPAVFFSWKGQALDFKIPLMRSEDKVRSAALRLLSLFDVEAGSVFSTLGCEQEYFLIDRAYYLLRPDLMLSGRTLCGNAPPKGQELEDSYFALIKKRVGTFMVDLERRSALLGIPLKTRHAEVAPSQFEAAPVFEKASIAIDHNILLMELMQETATSHGLACLLHEKPFAGVNGSGKHCNWSLSTDTGLNLLDPQQPQPLLFLAMLTAVIHAVSEYGGLLRAAIATAGNDHRLGGNEAPPAIISVYLGEALEKWLTQIEVGERYEAKDRQPLNLRVEPIPDILLDPTDRNRTSAFAFTGNKFEFRAVGASQHCATPITTLNVIIADSLNGLVDEIEKEVAKKRPLQEVALKVVRKRLKASKAIRFAGDNYSTSWHKEAKKRKLPIIEKSVHAFEECLTPKSIKAFEGVLSKKEIESRVEIVYERYCKVINIEARLLTELFHTQVLPAALSYQKEVAESLKALSSTGHAVPGPQERLLKQLAETIAQAIEKVHLLEKGRLKGAAAPVTQGALIYCDVVAPGLIDVRQQIDRLEALLDDRLWPLPKYREMLYIL